MVTPIQSNRRVTATLNLPHAVPALIAYAQGVVQRMTGNPSLPNPTPTIAAIGAAIADLQAAQTAALTRAKGTATVRNDKRTALVALLQQLRAYVQATADANQGSGAAIIESAGVAVRKTATRHARTFAATPGPVSGSAKVVAASAGQRASYEWQVSADGGKTWTAAPPTLQAKTTFSALPSGTIVAFKYRAVTRTGPGDWSATVSLLVQ